MSFNYKKIINLSSPLLITGETGTGKSKTAKEIYDQSFIFKEKFLTVHLASLKDDLLESELFGHKRGSFTGAVESKNGYLKDVGKGTLFLDEIGELSLDAQKKLLYLLEEKKFSPIGSTEALDFNGRIIMATNKNLKEMVSLGLFREDLYYRISIFELKLSPIRNDKNALKSSINEVFQSLKVTHKKSRSYLSELAYEFMMAKEWRGNFRELKNSLEYALVMSEGDQINASDFPNTLSDSPEEGLSLGHEGDFLSRFPDDFNLSLELFEKMYLNSILLKNSGKVNDTARKLGMSKTTLIQKAKKYQISTLKMRADASLLAA